MFIAVEILKIRNDIWLFMLSLIVQRKIYTYPSVFFDGALSEVSQTFYSFRYEQP